MLNRQLEHADGCTPLVMLLAALPSSLMAVVAETMVALGVAIMHPRACTHKLALTRTRTRTARYAHTRAQVLLTWAAAGRRASGGAAACWNTASASLRVRPSGRGGAATEGSRPPGRHYAAEGAAGGPP